MKLFKKLRKGFTLIELVVVIAVIAILSAVSVVSYVAITNRAHNSNDQLYIDQVNTSLTGGEILEKPATMHDALKAAEADGFKVENFKAESKSYEFAYSMNDNRFVILEDDVVVYPKNLTGVQTGVNLWKFASSNTLPAGYSYYLLDSVSGEITATGGIDVGSNKDITSISYSCNDSEQTVHIRAYGGSLNVGTASAIAKGQIYFHGLLDSTKVYTEENCFHTQGVIGKMELKAGKAIAEKGAVVYLTEAKPEASSQATVKIEEKGGQFIIPESVTTEAVPQSIARAAGYTVSDQATSYAEATKTESSYNISSVKELEDFRDLVNGGFSFSGCKVKLTSDISLKDGWSPIGEGSRNVGATKYEGNYAGPDAKARIFAGEFDGNGKTIFNLNNKGFTPRFTATDGVETYSYGFFGILSGSAYVHNLTLSGVDIDATQSIKSIDNLDSIGDSVGALVGFCGFTSDSDSVRIEYITVNGSVKAHESAAGIIGRAYPKTGALTVKGCVNNAAVTCDGKAAGIIGTLSSVSALDKLSIDSNSNTGTIKSNASYINAGSTLEKSSGYHHAAGILVKASDYNLSSFSNRNTGRLYVGSDEVEDSLYVYTSSKQNVKA